MKYKHSFIASLILIFATLAIHFLFKDTAIAEQKIYQWINIVIPQIASYILAFGFLINAIKISNRETIFWVFLTVIFSIQAVLMAGISVIALTKQHELIDYPWQMWVYVGYWLFFVILERIITLTEHKTKVVVL